MSLAQRSLNLSRLIPLLLAVASGAALFVTAQAVQDKRAELVKMQEKLAHERQSLRVLQAEWAYLNRPQRLARLAKTRLDLQPPTAAQILAPGQRLPVLMTPGLPPVKPDGVARVQPAAGTPKRENADSDNVKPQAGNPGFDAVMQSLTPGRGGDRQ